MKTKIEHKIHLLGSTGLAECGTIGIPQDRLTTKPEQITCLACASTLRWRSMISPALKAHEARIWIRYQGKLCFRRLSTRRGYALYGLSGRSPLWWTALTDRDQALSAARTWAAERKFIIEEVTLETQDDR